MDLTLGYRLTNAIPIRAGRIISVGVASSNVNLRFLGELVLLKFIYSPFELKYFIYPFHISIISAFYKYVNTNFTILLFYLI